MTQDSVTVCVCVEGAGVNVCVCVCVCVYCMYLTQLWSGYKQTQKYSSWILIFYISTFKICLYVYIYMYTSIC